MKKILIIVVCMVCFGMLLPKPHADADARPALAEADSPLETVDVKTLWEAFMTDAESAGKRYGGKRIIIEGFVMTSQPSVYATPEVNLSDSASGQILASCTLPRSSYPKLGYYTPGMAVRFIGTCDGLTFTKGAVHLADSVSIQ